MFQFNTLTVSLESGGHFVETIHVPNSDRKNFTDKNLTVLTVFHLNILVTFLVYSKAIWTDSECSRSLRLPHFITVGM
jgi:hypothetical protein